MIFNIEPRNLHAMVKDVNDMGQPHEFVQIGRGPVLCLGWRVDGDEPGYGKVIVFLEPNGTWTATLERA